ncbi:MAG: ATP-binding cassette domain-containing protein [Deltaproteobacteria bacterium]|nr:ATP-binding cassette domain-containing protein [Deltaproteobacteria bacterium]
MIEVRNLRKQFGSTVAVNDVSFRVQTGEIIGLLGPNGSGKTTIMRILTGFFPPTAGTAWVGGLSVEADSIAVRRLIGYLPESVVLYPDIPVARYLRFCGEVKDLTGNKLRERIEAVIEAVGLGEVRHREIGKLSKGYRQRVGLAQALIAEPALLILDEPTVGLDPSQVIEIRNLIRNLRGQSTILLSTHILHEVSLACDRVIIIHRGDIIAEDTAEGLNRRVQGVFQTLVRVDGPLPEVVGALRSLPGVDEVIEDAVPSDAATRLRIVSREGEPVRKAIARAIVDRGWSLIEVSPIQLTLEDLFVRLVRQQPSGH